MSQRSETILMDLRSQTVSEAQARIDQFFGKILDNPFVEKPGKINRGPLILDLRPRSNLSRGGRSGS